MKCALIFNLTGRVRKNKKLFLGQKKINPPEKLMNLSLLILLFSNCDEFFVDVLLPLVSDRKCQF